LDGFVVGRSVGLDVKGWGLGLRLGRLVEGLVVKGFTVGDVEGMNDGSELTGRKSYKVEYSVLRPEGGI